MTYINPGSCIAVSILLSILGLAAVLARFYVRLVLRKTTIGFDDWFCIPALLFTVACAADLVIGVKKHAIGYHTDLYATGAAKVAVLKAEKVVFETFYVFLILQTVALGCVKLSILFFYRRIFVGRIFNLVSWTMIAVVAGWTVAMLFANIFPCGTDFAAFWGTPADVNAHCVKTLKLAVAFAISDVIADVVILFIPLFWIWRLQMPLSQKISVSAIFLLGALAVASALCRCIVFAEAVFRPYLSPGKILGLESKDILGILSMGFFWTMTELGVAMVVCCLPSLRPLFHGRSVESRLSTIRGLFSLHSVPSKEDPYETEFKRIRSDAQDLSSSDTIPTRDTPSSCAGLESRKHGNILIDQDRAAGKIVVTKDVDQYYQGV